MKDRVIVTGGQASHTKRTMVIHVGGSARWGHDQLAEIDACYGDAKGVNVHLMGRLIGTHPGWRYQPSLEDGVAYVIRMHRRYGELPADLEVEWKS